MGTSRPDAILRNFPCPPPANLQELTNILQDEQYRVLTMTDDRLDNIYGGSVTDIDGFHHILFVSNRMLEIIRQFTVLHSDGTFKSVPVNRHFADQVFCLVGVWNDYIIPLAWALMSKRTEAAYTAILQLLQQLLRPQIELTRAITGFEAGQQIAWRRVFHILVQGSLWHLARAYIQNTATLGVAMSETQLRLVRRIIQFAVMLSLLPGHLIVTGFKAILDYARRQRNSIWRLARPFLLHVWRYWVSRPLHRSRMCFYGSDQQTSNVCQLHTQMLQGEVGTHPTIDVFIAGLLRLELTAYSTTLALREGHRIRRDMRITSLFSCPTFVHQADELLKLRDPIAAAVVRFLRSGSRKIDTVVDILLLDRFH